VPHPLRSPRPAPTRRAIGAILVALLATLAAAPAAQAARPLHIGFLDSVYASDERDPWLDRTAALNADTVRIDIGWPAPAGPTRPPGFDARNPADPQYDFSRADASIVAARSRGLQVIASFTGAPAWADRPGRPASVTPGTWKPSPQALEEYGAALARRYSGTFPDPARPGQTLPRVKAFQVWNEPNLSKYLNPQWTRTRATSPKLYRGMLNGFYRGVKSVDSRARVVTAGTAPFGDPGFGGRRIPPARFWRELLCLRLSSGRLSRIGCSNPARFDVLAHHPYSIGRPRRRAINPDDVSIPDIGKLTKVLRKAESTGRALPRKRHPIWVTETSYDSRPPDPDGVPAATHARWLEEAFFLLWRQGVDTITWFQIRDQLPEPSFAATNQSGVYLADGRAKLAARAFRFPLVAERASARSHRVWGRSPLAGNLVIERRPATSSNWQRVRTLHAARGATFLLRIARKRAGERLRARIGSETSLTWVAR
jgi:hypothetical protein